MRVHPSQLVPFVLAVVVSGISSAPPARAATSARKTSALETMSYAARDVSFPQCGAPLPQSANVAFGVLGVNDGRAFTANPCLLGELRWAKRLAQAPAFYMNTADPGPDARHWPLGQDAPMRCSTAEPNSTGCSFDYGWNAARDAFGHAAAAAQRLHHVSTENAHHRAANVDWWLDVEILNSWETLRGDPTGAAATRDTYALLGAVRGLWGEGVERVGIYSTSYQWNLITGGSGTTRDWFASNPVWLAGYDGFTDARNGCGDSSFTGGQVLLTQYLGGDGLDADVTCSSVGVG
jgi:hypothetical protein